MFSDILAIQVLFHDKGIAIPQKKFFSGFYLALLDFV